MFDFAVSTNAYVGFDLDDALKGIAQAGFRYVELNSSENKSWKKPLSGDFTPADVQELKEKLASYGLSAHSLCGYGQISVKSQHKNFENLIRIAGELGCSHIIHTLDSPEDGKDELTEEELIAAIRHFGDLCGEQGILLCLELHGKYVTGAKMSGLIQKIGHPNVKINYDTANGLYYENVPPYEDLEGCIDLVGAVHLKDNRGGHGVWDFPALGDGGIDLKRVLKTLSVPQIKLITVEIEYTPKGPGSIEYADETVKRSYEFLKREGYFNIAE